MDGSNGGCDQICNNENGTFSCDCNAGYTLNINGSTCDGKDSQSEKLDKTKFGGKIFELNILPRFFFK